MDAQESLAGSPPPPALRVAARKGRAGWVLVAGLALAAIGLVSEPNGALAGTRTTSLQPGLLPQNTSGQGGGAVQPTSSVPGIGVGYGTADSNGSMIAVTGIDVTGGSLLYIIDTESKQLAVYQAQGGTSSTMNVKFVGGRRIDLDLQVYGYNDESDYSYEELQKEFGKAGGSLPREKD